MVRRCAEPLGCPCDCEEGHPRSARAISRGRGDTHTDHGRPRARGAPGASKAQRAAAGTADATKARPDATKARADAVLGGRNPASPGFLGVRIAGLAEAIGAPQVELRATSAALDTSPAHLQGVMRDIDRGLADARDQRSELGRLERRLRDARR